MRGLRRVLSGMMVPDEVEVPACRAFSNDLTIEDLRDIGRQAERVLFDILMNSTMSLMSAGLTQERIEEAVRTAVVVDVLGS